MASLGVGPGDFIYFVGLRGTTGAAADFRSPELVDKVHALRSMTGKPVVIGFGIKNSDDARTALSLGDGFVIGTEAVRRQCDAGALRGYLGDVLAV
jgi:tryptophan synthase alpha chain